MMKNLSAKLSTGLLAAAILNNTNSNAETTNIYTLTAKPINATNSITFDSQKLSSKLVSEESKDKDKFQGVLPEFVFRANRKLESRFSVNPNLYDTISQFDHQGKPLRDIYADRMLGGVESAAIDVGRKLGEDIFGRIGEYLFSPSEERKINISYEASPSGIAGEYLGKKPNRWKPTFDLIDGEFSLVYDPGANTLLNINMGANGASFALKKNLFDNVNFVAGAEYGGIRIRPEKAEMNWNQNVNVFMGISHEVRERKESGLEHTTKSWQLGVNAQNPSGGFAPTKPFTSFTYNIKF